MSSSIWCHGKARILPNYWYALCVEHGLRGASTMIDEEKHNKNPRSLLRDSDPKRLNEQDKNTTKVNVGALR